MKPEKIKCNLRAKEILGKALYLISLALQRHEKI